MSAHRRRPAGTGPCTKPEAVKQDGLLSWEGHPDISEVGGQPPTALLDLGLLQRPQEGEGGPELRLLSQLFGLLYLNDLDFFNAKFCKYYLRYVDDFVLFFESKEEAKEHLKNLKEFLKTQDLELSKANLSPLFKKLKIVGDPDIRHKRNQLCKLLRMLRRDRAVDDPLLYDRLNKFRRRQLYGLIQKTREKSRIIVKAGGHFKNFILHRTAQ